MRIISAIPQPGHRLALEFDNGESGVVDLSSFAGRGVFAVWDTPGIFEQVTISDEGAVQWPGDIDMCPDALYLRMTGLAAEEVFPSLRNRVSHA